VGAEVIAVRAPGRRGANDGTRGGRCGRPPRGVRRAELLHADSGVGAPADRGADSTRDRAGAAVGVEPGTVASEPLGQGFIREMP
jgi:hypothetical protein